MSLEDMYHYADGTADEQEQEYLENNWKTNP